MLKGSEAARLANANKTKWVHHFSETWLLGLFADSVLNKGKYAIPPLFNSQEGLSSASDKAKFLAKNVSKNSNLYDLGISLSVSLVELIYTA